MKTQIAVTALAVLLAFAIASADATYVPCKIPTCPSGFTPYNWGGLRCPSCIRWPTPLQCPSLLTPICCGGVDEKPCPGIACATSTSYAIAGSTGCASAFSKVTALSISDFQYRQTVNDTADALATFCSAGYSDEEAWNTAIAVHAEAAAKAYAKAVAKAIYDFFIYVCDCGKCTRTITKGCGTLAVGNVTAQIQAVATAQAYVYVKAIAQVRSVCFPTDTPGGDYIAYAESEAEAFAQKTAVAINDLVKEVTTKGLSAGACRSLYDFSVEKAVAKAVACGFVNVLASARDSCTPDVQRACTSSFALAGDDLSSQYLCKFTSFVCSGSRKLKMM